jgi:hypothetical protein
MHSTAAGSGLRPATFVAQHREHMERERSACVQLTRAEVVVVAIAGAGVGVETGYWGRL